MEEAFPDEQVFVVKRWCSPSTNKCGLTNSEVDELAQLWRVKMTRERPWYADIANFVVTGKVPLDFSCQ